MPAKRGDLLLPQENQITMLRTVRVKMLMGVLLALVTPSLTTKVQLFTGINNTGYKMEFDITDKCENVPWVINPLFGSVKTAGCVMVYNVENCGGYSGKVVNGSENFQIRLYDSPEGGLLLSPKYGGTIWTNNFAVQSFHACNETIGGPNINVDVSERRNSRHTVSFKDVCACQNLPPKLIEENDPLTINNHGNSILVYDEEDCQGNHKVVYAGYNVESEVLTVAGDRLPFDAPYVPTHSAKSFAPLATAEYRHNCVRLTSMVYKFEFLKPVNNETAFEENEELAATASFFNNGGAKIVQEYKVTKKIKNSVTVEVAESLSNMDSVGVEANVEVETEAGLPLIGNAKFKLGLKASYAQTNTQTNSNSNGNTVEDEKEVTVLQHIEVPPCTEYKAMAHIHWAVDKPLPYKAYNRITGRRGEDKMTVDQIRKFVGPTLEILRDLDAYTVETVAHGEMKVNHELGLNVVGEGVKIKDCDVRK